MTFLSSSPSRRRLVARLAALSASLAALAPGAAHAADVGVTIGPYLSFVFGEELGIGWGVETTILVAPGGDLCSDGLGDDDWGVGPHLELGAVNLSKVRLVAAVAAGGALADEDSGALLGEAGVAFHMTREDAEPGVVHRRLGGCAGRGEGLRQAHHHRLALVDQGGERLLVPCAQ